MAKAKKIIAQEITKQEIKPGMVVKLYQRVKDVNQQGKEKERIQPFEGLVIAKKGTKNHTSITMRKVSNGVGVEKIFPLSLPTIEKVELLKKYITRRSKLYFIRTQHRKLKEDKSGLESTKKVSKKLVTKKIENKEEVVAEAK